ncbi:M56 family metallopeptidase [Planctomycetota bacterium]
MEALNTHLQPFLTWLLRGTLQATILICLILFIQAVLGRRLGIRWRYCLWLVLLVRMALPWAPQSRISMFNLLPTTISARQETPIVQESNHAAPALPMYTQPSMSEQGDQTVADSVGTEGTENGSLPATHMPSVSPAKPTPGIAIVTTFLPFVWLAGAFMLAIYIVIGNIRLWWLVSYERPLTDQPTLDLLEDCKSQIGTRTLLAVIPTDKVSGPALFGFVRPRLLLPKDMLVEMKPDELRYIFLHELAHLKRHDIAIGYIVSILQILHWFNPLVLLGFKRMRADRELAADGLAMSVMKDHEPSIYGHARQLERFLQPRWLPSLAGISEDKGQIKRRIAMIAQFKKNSYHWSPLAAFIIITLACFSLSDAMNTNTSEVLDALSTTPISIRRVWSGPLLGLSGEPSPDGRYLSYVDWETGDLAIYEIATETKRRLTDKDVSKEFALESRWSPDGTQIAYTWEKESPSVELRIVGLDGAEPRILYTLALEEQTSWIELCAWFPDGKHLLAHYTAKDGTDQIVKIATGDGSLSVLKTVGKNCLGHVVFSPDGEYVAYDIKRDVDDLSSNRDIHMISTDGRQEAPFVEHPADDAVLGWAPDGKHILFASDRNGSQDVWLVRVDNGTPQGAPKRIRSGGFSPLGFTRDGSFYYGVSQGGSYVYEARLDSETGKIIETPKKAALRYEGRTIVSAYSPDGKYLAYACEIGAMVRRGHDPTLLCIRSLESGRERQFPVDLHLYNGSEPRWSPDCSTLLVGGKDQSNRYGLFRINVTTGDIVSVVMSEGENEISGYDWAHDGESVFYSYKNGQIVHRNLENGQTKEISPASPIKIGSKISVSPDGTRLALATLHDEDRTRYIKVVPAAGGELCELLKFEKGDPIATSVTWTADGKHLLFAKKSQEQNDWELCQISAEGGPVQKLGPDGTWWGWMNCLSAHPDGRRIAFRSSGPTAGHGEVWVMENFLPEQPIAEPVPTPTLRQIEVRGRGSVHSKPSFDGRYMLNVDKETGNLVALELATGKERLLTKNTDPNWFVHGSLISRDSTKVAFYHYNPEKEDFDLRIVGLDGSDLRTILGAEIAGIFNMDAWSPDGKYIFGKFMNEPMQFVRVSTDDGSMEAIRNFDNGEASNVDVSPDGRYLAYSRTEQETSNPDIFVFDLERNQEAPLVTHSASDKLLGWTPDGEHIFFTSDRNGTWDGWFLRVVDGKALGLPEMIKAGMGDVDPIGFTKDGLFYYTFQHEAWNVYTAILDTNKGEVLSDPDPVRGVGNDGCPDWSPDGRYLAYCSQFNNGKTQQIIRIRTLATGQERELKIDLPRFGWLRWCPDNRHLLITNFNWNSPSMVYKVNVQTGAYTPLVKSEQRLIRQAELSADGKTLAYRIRGTGNSNWLIIKNLETGSEQELLQTDGGTALAFAGGWTLSPDGKHVAYSIREDVNSPFVLKIISVESGEARTIVGDEVWQAVWTNDGRHLLFTKNHNELWRVTAVLLVTTSWIFMCEDSALLERATGQYKSSTTIA